MWVNAILIPYEFMGCIFGRIDNQNCPVDNQNNLLKHYLMMTHKPSYNRWLEWTNLLLMLLDDSWT